MTLAPSAVRGTQAIEAALLAPDDGRDLRERTLPPPQRLPHGFGVLDVSEYFAPGSGGVRTYLMQKARYVRDRPWLRQVLAVPGTADGIGEIEGVRCYRLKGPLIPLQDTYRFLLATRSLNRIVGHERPDVVELGSSYFAPWLVQRAARAHGVPSVWFYHANLPRILCPAGEDDTPMRRVAASVAWAYCRRIAATVDRVVVASTFVQAELERQGVTNTVHVPLGVDAVQFHPSRRAHAPETRRRLGLPRGPLVAFVGRFSVDKDLGTLLTAWHTVYRRTGASLVLVGDGGVRERVAPLAPPRGVHWVPFISDRAALADLFAAVDIVVAPGPTETFGLAAIEAMACGTPVLACDIGGVTESVHRSGAGAIYPTRDAAALAEVAINLLEADLPALGQRARAWAEGRHAWERVFDQLFEVYRGVAGG